MPKRGALKKKAWHVSLARFARRFHNWVGALLGLIVVVIPFSLQSSIHRSPLTALAYPGRYHRFSYNLVLYINK